MTDTIILINQIVANRRLAQIEAEISRQQSDANLQQLQHEKLLRQKEILFSVKKRLEELLPIKNSSPKQCAYVLNLLFTQLKINEINIDSFPDMIDKEYASRVFELMDHIRESYRLVITDKEQHDIHELSQKRFGLIHLENLTAWLKIREKLPAVPFYRRITGQGGIFWIIILGLVQVIMPIPHVFLDWLSVEHFQLITSFIYIMMGVVILRALWFRRMRKYWLPKLSKLAESVGGHLGENPTKQNVAHCIREENERVNNFGIEGQFYSAKNCEQIMATTEDRANELSELHKVE